MRTKQERNAMLWEPPIEPLAQGELDGLCGVYATINAARLLCPELSNDVCELLFKRLLSELEELYERPLPAIWQGLPRWVVRRLATSTLRYVRETFGVSISAEALAKNQGKTSLPQLWGGLSDAMAKQQIALLAYAGLASHWTVAYQITPRFIRLFDAGERQLLLRSQATLLITTRRIQLLPDHIILLQRQENSSEW